MTDQITDEQAEKGYYYLGLSGESAETIEKIVQDASNKDIALECSDTCWYSVRLLFRLNGVTGIPDADVDEMFNAKEMSTSPLDSATAMIVVAGKVCERYKKVVRDRNGVYTKDDVNDISDMCLGMFRLLAVLGKSIGYKLSEILEMNLAKLASRQARNMIHGNGDNR